MKNIVYILLSSSLLLFGCTSEPHIYNWDSSYTESMYLYLKDDPDTSRQQELMNEYFESAAANGKKVAPGAYAHMGLLFYKNNDPVQAEEYFTMEKNLYPESSHYIDFLLKKSSNQQNNSIGGNNQ